MRRTKTISPQNLSMVFNPILKRTLIAILTALPFVALVSCSEKPPKSHGLIGIYYSEPDLTSIKGISVLESLTQVWDDRVDYQGGSSGEWEGFVLAPASGKVTFHVKTNRRIRMKLGDMEVTASGDEPESTLEIDMKKGGTYPVRLVFYNPEEGRDAGWFDISWSWKNQEKKAILSSDIYYTDKEADKLSFLMDIEKPLSQGGDKIRIQGYNVVVYYAQGRFGGWPANAGIWSWGDEILVGFTLGYYKPNKYHHAFDKGKPSVTAFARSADGGKTWTLVDTVSIKRFNRETSATATQKINYTANGFALFNKDGSFYYSYDKGQNWSGPFEYPEFQTGNLTSRTDYLAQSEDTCLLFLSAKSGKVRAALQDHAFCAVTTDGGRSFQFLSWMTEQDSIRSVMPSTVRVGKDHLISALRRRLDPPQGKKYALADNWIDVYESKDNGKSWHFLNKIANTDNGIRNGNPPSLVKTKNGLLAVVYASRAVPYGIRAKISMDLGKTWSNEIVLRDDAKTWDIGYVKSVVRPDDKVVSVFYYSTDSLPERHIEAIIWDPESIMKTKLSKL